MKKPTQSQEIMWNIINSALAGAISFISAMLSVVSTESYEPHQLLTAFMIAIGTSLLVAIYKFKDFWDGERTEYQRRILNFI